MSSLEELLSRQPSLAPAAAGLHILTTVLPEATLPAGVPNREAVRARLEAGLPALEGEPLLRGPELLAAVRTLAAALSQAAPEFTSTFDYSRMIADADALAAASQAGAWDMIEAWADGAGVEPKIVTVLVDYAVRPFLRAGAMAAQDTVEQVSWKRGTCPACGAAPLLGELRSGRPSGAERERVLRCGRCLTGWPFPRLQCTACGEANHERLSYVHLPGEETFRRAEVCSSCRKYLKSIAVLAPLGLLELVNADLATVALDFAAMELGFHR